MGFWSQFKPISVKVYDDGNEQKIEVINNPDNKWAPAEVVRFYDNEKENVHAMEMGSFKDLIQDNEKVKKLKCQKVMRY